MNVGRAEEPAGRKAGNGDDTVREVAQHEGRGM